MANTIDINSIMTITNAGLRLYNKVQRGECGLRISGVTVGDGWLAEGETLETLQALKHELSSVETSITGVLTISDGQTRFRVSIDTAQDDYYLREIAVWATDPDEGDIIYAACNFGEHADYIKTYGGTVLTEQVYDLYVATGRATEINVDIVSSAQVTRAEFEAHTSDKNNPHGVTAEQIGFANKAVLDSVTNDVVGNSHRHSNNATLDGINDTKVSNWDATAAHVNRKDNPHTVTKSQVGLGNVPNVTTNTQTPTYTTLSTPAKLTSGENLSTAFGKIQIAISRLIDHLLNFTLNDGSMTLTLPDSGDFIFAGGVFKLDDAELGTITFYDGSGVGSDITIGYQDIKRLLELLN